MNVKIDTMKSPNEIPEESRKRRLEDLDAGSLSDPWKIKKTLTQSDCDRLYRLTLCKDMVQNHIIKVWEEAGRVDEIEKVESDEGVAIKVWDYEREKEYELKLKKLSSSKSSVVSGAWRKEFVKERRLKKGDIQIRLFCSCSCSSYSCFSKRW
nr:PREDICTED: B3 domain-containing protein At2g33720-like [Daucus carota subsp. sativus]